MGLLDFFSVDAGQARRKWLDENAQGLLDQAGYYLGPHVMDRVNGLLSVGDMLNPVSDIGRAGASARTVFDPSKDITARTAAAGSMLTDMASVLAPAVGAKYSGDAVKGITEALANWSAPADDAVARFAGADDGAIKAWHGSPHDFDRFDMSKIGTGEGAQAYGHGLYFAENENVARGYRDALTKNVDPKSHWALDGHSIGNSGLDLAKRYLDDAGGDVTAARIAIADKINSGVKPWARTDHADALRALELAEAGQIRPISSGRLYEVNINANPEDFLDWDKPLSEQPRVAEILGFSSRPEQDIHDEALLLMQEGNQREPGKMWFDFPDLSARVDELQGELDRRVPSVTGQEYYRGGADGDVSNILSQMGYGNPVDQSQALREAGIPGIRYLDAGSRGAGDGSRNYVVFNDRLVDILGKDGARNTPEGRAQDILDMLASGRGSEVTDQMLDLGDPVQNARLNDYLFRNYDLPMDEASRMQRAADMGMTFDTFHGSPDVSNTTELRPSASGEVGRGVYHTRSPEYAEAYTVRRDADGDVMAANGAGILPLRSPKPEMIAREDWVRLRDNEMMRILAERGDEWSRDIPDVAEANISADIPGGFYFQGGGINEQGAIPNPANIRSRFARFDPRLAHLRNLSAGLAGLGLLGDYIGQPQGGILGRQQ